MNLSYSLYTNFQQCPFRVVLLQHQRQQPLFVGQYIGLYAHEYIERRLVGGSIDPDEIFDAIVNKDRYLPLPVETYHKAMERWVPYLEGWYEQVAKIIESDGAESVQVEQRLRASYGSFDVVGIVDILAKTSSGYNIYDLKRSGFRRHYDGKQLALYSYVVHHAKGIGKDAKLKLLFLDRDGVSEVGYPLDWDTAKGILEKLSVVAHALEEGAWELFKPNTQSKYCAPNRCSMWDFCPFGGLHNEDSERNVGQADLHSHEGRGDCRPQFEIVGLEECGASLVLCVEEEDDR